MKTNILNGAILLTCFTGLFVFKPMQTSIVGRINPIDGSLMIFAVNGNDTIRTTTSSFGAFLLDVRPGVYKLLVDAKEPYKDVEIINLEVKQGQTLDVGEILLQP